MSWRPRYGYEPNTWASGPTATEGRTPRNPVAKSESPENLYKSYIHPNTVNSDALLIIDPQYDFHDKNGHHGDVKKKGKLPVAGAHEDAERIAAFIRKNIDTIGEIYVTMDTHQRHHIAHPMYWRKVGENVVEHPDTFTTITLKDYNTVWEPTRRDMIVDKNGKQMDWALYYLRELERQKDKKAPLMIWPEHCLFGSTGWTVHVLIREALNKWEMENKRNVKYIIKGNNSRTEHYSAIRAEVIDPDDPVNTGDNMKLVNALTAHNKVYICGQALSHCVGGTVDDLVRLFKGEGEDCSKLILLGDCSSRVTHPDKDTDDQLEIKTKEYLRHFKESGVLFNTHQKKVQILDRNGILRT